jgi:hypothetical protein
VVAIAGMRTVGSRLSTNKRYGYSVKRGAPKQVLMSRETYFLVQSFDPEGQSAGAPLSAGRKKVRGEPT